MEYSMNVVNAPCGNEYMLIDTLDINGNSFFCYNFAFAIFSKHEVVQIQAISVQKPTAGCLCEGIISGIAQ